MLTTTPLLQAIDALIEANTALRKSRALTKPELRLERALTRAFRTEGRLFLARFEQLAPTFPPELREVAESDRFPIYDQVALETADAFQKPLTSITGEVLESGMASAVADLGVDTAFDLKHPLAVEFMSERGAEQVTRIRETTRETLRRILTQATDEGWSHQKTARAIRRRYQHFGAARSRRIARYELGNAYEAGNLLVAKDLQSAGLTMEKQWLSVGDAKTRPAHRGNQAQGWIPLDDRFQDGSDRPPTDSGCRCTLLMRRKPDA